MNKEHPFVGTLGPGPYKLVGTFTIEKPSEANHGRNNYNEIPKGWHVGTCAHCGTGILNNFMIQNAEGKLQAVGSECVKKLSLPYAERTKFEKIIAEQNAEKRRIRLEIKGKAARELLEKLLAENADFLKGEQYNERSTLFDYVSFCLKNMGNTNIQWLAKYIQNKIDTARG